MATENPTRGYNRIQGALANLGHSISDATVGNILRQHGIEPAPERAAVRYGDAAASAEAFAGAQAIGARGIRL